jgi:hypothetical protein
MTGMNTFRCRAASIPANASGEDYLFFAEFLALAGAY